MKVFVYGVFTFCIVLMLALFTFYGFLAYKGAEVLLDPKGTAHSLGETVKEFKKGLDE